MERGVEFWVIDVQNLDSPQALMRRFLADPASVGYDVVAEVARRRVPVRPGRSRPRPLRAVGFAPLRYR